MTITIKVDPSFIAAIEKLAAVLLPGGIAGVQTPDAEPAEPVSPQPSDTPTEADFAPPAPPAPPVAPPAAPSYTLEQVRAELSLLPTSKAREIIQGFGVPKLTAIEPNRYPELMAQVKEAQ